MTILESSCEHEWVALQDGAIGCRKCFADKTVLESALVRRVVKEPDFLQLTRDYWEPLLYPIKAGTVGTERKMEFARKMYCLGFISAQENKP